MRAGSFVNRWVFLEVDTFVNPMAADKNTFIHELYHQIQYYQNPFCQIGLISEFSLNEQMANKGSIIGYEAHSLHDGGMYTKPVYDGKTVENYTYQYDKFNLSKYETLSDFPFYEAQAQFVGDYAELYFNARFGKLENPDEDKMRLKQMSIIMNNSGYENTEAVRWILKDMK